MSDGVSVSVGVAVSVAVGVRVTVLVGDGVNVAVGVAVADGVGDSVGVGVSVTSGVRVANCVLAGVGVLSGPEMRIARTASCELTGGSWIISRPGAMASNASNVVVSSPMTVPVDVSQNVSWYAPGGILGTINAKLIGSGCRSSAIFFHV